MTWQNRFQQAVSAHHGGKFPEAKLLYEQVLTAEPRHFPAWYQLAFLLYQLQRWPEALSAVEAALALNPHDSGALMLQGVLLSHAERHEAALAAFDTVLAAQPASAEALYHRGNVLLDLARHPEAVAAFDAVLAQSPGLFEAWSNRGLALFEMKRWTEALESYDRALAIRPSDARAWSNRGKALQSLGRFDDAIASYDKATTLVPEYAEAWYARGLALRTQHRLTEALDCIDRALAIRGPAPDMLSVRGQLLWEMGRIADGMDVIRRAASQSPRSVSAWEPEHRGRHDAEQRDYLKAQGVRLAEDSLHIAGGERVDDMAVTPGNAAQTIAAWEKHRPRIAVIDNFLTGPALDRLRRFCWESTVWRTTYPAGYLGAMPEQGFACPLLAQIAEELRDNLPAIIGNHPLRMLWGFKYDSRLAGIGLHADQAAVNVNFWITPGAVNRNPESGGMVIWDVAAPQDWDIAKYNGDEAAVRAFLAQSGAKPIVVPYRANRAVIFDSGLFHKTDAIDFEEGYLNRRINVTMLYGRRTYYGG